VAAQTVEVRIVEGALLWHEGRAYHAGHTLRVSEQEAAALEQAGTAVRVGKARRKREAAVRERRERAVPPAPTKR
jgi:hypothetical protein